MTRGAAPKKRNASTWPRRKLGIAKHTKCIRLKDSTITKAKSGRSARPTLILPKCAQSTWASSPGKTAHDGAEATLRAHVAPRRHHAPEATRAKTRILRERRLDEGHVRVDETPPRRLFQDGDASVREHALDGVVPVGRPLRLAPPLPSARHAPSVNRCADRPPQRSPRIARIGRPPRSSRSGWTCEATGDTPTVGERSLVRSPRRLGCATTRAFTFPIARSTSSSVPPSSTKGIDQNRATSSSPRVLSLASTHHLDECRVP